MMYLHENHILHGNLRPENIYIDDNFQPVISDFGLTQIFNHHVSNIYQITKTSYSNGKN